MGQRNAAARRQFIADLCSNKQLLIQFIKDIPRAIAWPLVAGRPVLGSDPDQSDGLAIFASIRQRSTLTTDWFSFNIPVWTGLLAGFKHEPCDVLEIGSFEGASSMFALEYLPSSTITCIDSFFVRAGMENWPGNIRVEDTESVFDRNLGRYGERCRKIKANSWVGLNQLWMEGKEFDLIYVDGSHEAEDCLGDSVLCWRLLKPGGLIIWDDYLWELQQYGKHTPAWGIHAFCRIFADELSIIHARYQVAGRKALAVAT